MEIYGEKVKLRAMEPEDMEMYRRLVNDPEVEHGVPGWGFPVSTIDQMKWFEATRADPTKKSFTIIELATGMPVGVYTVHNLDWHNRSCLTGYKLIPEGRGRGLAFDADTAFAKYGYDELGMHRITGAVIVTNAKSRNVIHKGPTSFEGLRREAVYKNGQWYDVIETGTLENEWREWAIESNWNGYGDAYRAKQAEAQAAKTESVKFRDLLTNR